VTQRERRKGGENPKTPSDDWRRDVGDLDDVCSPLRHVRALYLFTYCTLLYSYSSSSSSSSSSPSMHTKRTCRRRRPRRRRRHTQIRSLFKRLKHQFTWCYRPICRTIKRVLRLMPRRDSRLGSRLKTIDELLSLLTSVSCCYLSSLSSPSSRLDSTPLTFFLP
jgi:hypothetical protein